MRISRLGTVNPALCSLSNCIHFIATTIAIEIDVPSEDKYCSCRSRRLKISSPDLNFYYHEASLRPFLVLASHDMKLI